MVHVGVSQGIGVGSDSCSSKGRRVAFRHRPFPTSGLASALDLSAFSVSQRIRDCPNSTEPHLISSYVEIHPGSEAGSLLRLNLPLPAAKTRRSRLDERISRPRP